MAKNRKTGFIVIAKHDGSFLVTQCSALNIPQAIEEACQAYEEQGRDCDEIEVIFVGKGRIGENLLPAYLAESADEAPEAVAAVEF